jgi:hypothetical protein
MKKILCGMCILVGGLAGCGQKEAAKPAPATNAPAKSSVGNPLTAPVDYIGVMGKAQKAAVKTVDLSALKQGIQAFKAGEDRLPKDLNELVTSGYLPRLPEAPRGAKFTYNPSTGQVGLVQE